MSPKTVTFQSLDTAIFQYIILAICKQNDVINWNLISVDNLKTKRDIKEI